MRRWRGRETVAAAAAGSGAVAEGLLFGTRKRVAIVVPLAAPRCLSGKAASFWRLWAECHPRLRRRLLPPPPPTLGALLSSKLYSVLGGGWGGDERDGSSPRPEEERGRGVF